MNMYNMEKPSTENGPHSLAKRYEISIKKAVFEGTGVPTEELELMLKDKDGVYFSEEQPDTFCCLVLGRENGHLYLATAEFSEVDDTLDNFKVTTLS